MAQWNHLQSLCMKNRDLHEKVNALYRRSSFPYKIRSCFAHWIESQNWQQLDLSSAEGKREVQRLYRELMALVQTTEEEMQSSSKFDLEKTLDFNQVKETLKREFEGNCVKLAEQVKMCLDEEQSLLLNPQNGDEALSHMKGKEEIPRAVENKAIRQKLDNLKQKLLAAERALEDLEMKQNAFLESYKKILAQIQNIEVQLLSPHVANEQRNDLINVKKNLEYDKSQLVMTTFERRNVMVDTHIRLAIEEANLLQLIWQEIMNWHQDQKKLITGLAQPKKGSLDVLDTICDHGGQLLYQMIEQLERMFQLLNMVSFQDDRKKQQIQIVLKELTGDYLPMHLKKTFVIEQNIPDRVLKVNSGRSGNFSMAVRILGGKAFGLDFSKPKVKMAVFFEKDIPEADTFVQGACDIVNGDEKVFTVHHTNNACSAQFYSIQLRNVKRPDRGRNEELVTDQKYAFMFFTTITVFGRSYPLKVTSLPIILTSQTSQEIMAKGTLIWDAAFSSEGRTPYQYREMVPWRDVAAVLNALFLQYTGRGLTEDHLNYLAKMAFRERNDQNFSDMIISEKQLIKDRLPQRDFSFWKWFWANLNLVKDRVKKEWQDGLIYGFISKEDVRSKLMDLEVGTFLLRFSETNIEVSQRSDVSGFLTLSFIEMDPSTGQRKLFHVKEYLSPREIQEKGLPQILNAMEVSDYQNSGRKKPLLRFLWPRILFDDVFATNTIQTAYPSPGYIGGRFTIEIFLTENPNRRRQDSIDSSESTGSPGSPHSAVSIPFSPATVPALSTIGETTMDDSLEEEDSGGSIEIPSLSQTMRPMAAVPGIPQQPFSSIGMVRPAEPLLPPSITGRYSPSSPMIAELLLDPLHGLDIDGDSALTFDSDGDLVMRRF